MQHAIVDLDRSAVRRKGVDVFPNLLSGNAAPDLSCGNVFHGYAVCADDGITPHNNVSYDLGSGANPSTIFDDRRIVGKAEANGYLLVNPAVISNRLGGYDGSVSMLDEESVPYVLRVNGEAAEQRKEKPK